MNLDEMIKVGMADLQLCKSPGVLTTLGLGSCVGVALYDPVNKIGGLLHCMLPDSTQFKNNSNTAKYADSGIDELVSKMVSLGANRSRIVAKIAGGAQMFAMKTNNDTLRLAREMLRQLRKNCLKWVSGFYQKTVDLIMVERWSSIQKMAIML